ncbi:MAG: hypothetical protein WA655_15710 [Candidatus Korobacteraceae bacterium]
MPPEARTKGFEVMRSLAGLAFVVLGITVSLAAQAVTPMELSDPKTQRLQQRHLKTLMAIGAEIEAHKFPYPFYFSRVLDVDVDKMQTQDQRSIRFDIYKGQTVLEITGNYYAAYSADRMDDYARLKETFQSVVTPLLQAAVPHFPDDSEFAAFAIEISHHVRQKIMGISSERPENVTLIIPVLVAQKFVDAKTDDERQAAILEAQLFLNGQPFSLWLGKGEPSGEWKERTLPPPPTNKPALLTVSAASNSNLSNSPSVAANLLKPSVTPMRIITPESLTGLERQNQDAIDRLVKGLDPEAHFLAYVPPTFIGFRQGAYLQLSFNTPLEAPATSSRYKLAALAFDEHISHLIRPLLNYFPADVEFDGVDFSSSLHVTGDSAAEAVEFFFPFRMMRCFANYDCTGQQLLDSGTVVINGERATLDLQIAEGKN